MPMARFLGYEDQGVGADRRCNRIVGGRIFGLSEKTADFGAGGWNTTLRDNATGAADVIGVNRKRLVSVER